jgi:hypothetical protein
MGAVGSDKDMEPPQAPQLAGAIHTILREAQFTVSNDRRISVVRLELQH